jgi:hypothetical protein
MSLIGSVISGLIKLTPCLTRGNPDLFWTPFSRLRAEALWRASTGMTGVVVRNNALYKPVTVSLHPSRLNNLNLLPPPVNPQYDLCTTSSVRHRKHLFPCDRTPLGCRIQMRRGNFPSVVSLTLLCNTPFVPSRASGRTVFSECPERSRRKGSPRTDCKVITVTLH